MYLVSSPSTKFPLYFSASWRASSLGNALGMSLIMWSFVFVSSIVHVLKILCCFVGFGRPEGVEGDGVDFSS